MCLTLGISYDKLIFIDKIMWPPFFGGTTLMALYMYLYLYVFSFVQTPYYFMFYHISGLGFIFNGLSTALSVI